MTHSPWQRVSPIAVIYFTLLGFKRLLGQTIPLVTAGAVAVVSLRLESLLFGFAGLFLLVGGWAMAYYLVFAYRLGLDRLWMREGLFNRKRIEIPFNKIQNVHTTTPFYFRPFGLVVLRIDSAGSSGSEIELVGLSRAAAEHIQKAIGQQPDVADEPARAPLLLRRSWRQIALHGLTNNRAWWLLVLCTPLFNQADLVLIRAAQRFDLNLQSWLAEFSTTALLAFTLFLVVSLVVMLAFISVIGALLSLSGYQLEWSGGSVVRRSGMFNQSEVRLQRAKIQTVKIYQSALDRLWGRANVLMESFSGGRAARESEALNRNVFIPALQTHEVDPLLAQCYPGIAIKSLEFQPISAGYMVRAWFFYAVPLTLLVGLVSYFESPYWEWIALMTHGLISALIVLRWRQFGVALVAETAYLRCGLFGLSIYCIPVAKVQQVALLQTPLSARRQLASVVLITASRSCVLPLVPRSLAMSIIDKTLRTVNDPACQWM